MNYIPLGKLFYQSHETYHDVYQSRFNSESSIHLNFNLGEHPAFIVVNHEMLQVLSSVLKADKNLSVLAENIPAIGLKQFTDQCMVEEIKLSNDIEGVHSTRKEILSVLRNESDEKTKKRFEGIINKFNLLSSKSSIPLNTCQDVRNLYDETFLHDVLEENSENKPDGQYFRKESVSVYSGSQKELHCGAYPESKIIELMTAGLQLVQNDNIDPLISLSVFHYLFGYIHPFYDGNGRMSRFISSYLLSRHLHFLTAFGLSNAIKQNKSKYYKMFKTANDSKNLGDLTPFVIEFLELLLFSLNETIGTLNSKLDKFKYFNQRLAILAGSDDSYEHLLSVLRMYTLFGLEGLTIMSLEEETGLKQNTIRNYLRKTDSQFLRIDKTRRQYRYELDLNVLDSIIVE